MWTFADLLEHRTGCVICMDYSDYNREYHTLFIHFKAISKILLGKLTELRDKSLRSQDAFLFGFSFGARLITRAATDFGPKLLGVIHCECTSLITFLAVVREIFVYFLLLSWFLLIICLLLFHYLWCCVVCDPAGPGFDVYRAYEPRNAAHHSQCFHTDSGGYGTTDRGCHQDWHLGDCGIHQSAAG